MTWEERPRTLRSAPDGAAAGVLSDSDCHNPHGYTVRTMRAYTRGGPDLVWYGAAGDRTKTSINAFGIVNEFRSV